MNDHWSIYYNMYTVYLKYRYYIVQSCTWNFDFMYSKNEIKKRQNSTSPENFWNEYALNTCDVVMKKNLIKLSAKKCFTHEKRFGKLVEIAILFWCLFTLNPIYSYINSLFFLFKLKLNICYAHKLSDHCVILQFTKQLQMNRAEKWND